jgi:hypothetical protein
VIAGDAVADAVDAAELFGIDVDQLAGTLALVADCRRLRVEMAQATQPEPAQHHANRRARHGELASDLRAGHALPAQPLDLGNPLGRHRSAVSSGRRAPVAQHPLAARPIPPQPMVRAADRQASRRCCIGNLPALLFDPTDHQESTLRRQASILMDVHLGLRLAVGRLATTSFASPPQMNNLHSFDS